jgi:hypothetical protein
MIRESTIREACEQEKFPPDAGRSAAIGRRSARPGSLTNNTTKICYTAQKRHLRQSVPRHQFDEGGAGELAAFRLGVDRRQNARVDRQVGLRGPAGMSDQRHAPEEGAAGNDILVNLGVGEQGFDRARLGNRAAPLEVTSTQSRIASAA